MMETVLVAGYDRADNPVVKFVTEYGLKAFHVSHLDHKELPKADLVIVAAENCGHMLVNKIKSSYTSDRVIYANGGTSNIVEQFNKLVVDPHKSVLNEMRNLQKIQYFLNVFYKPKDKFESTELQNKLHKYFEISQPAFSVDIRRCIDLGTVSKTEKRGYYIFNGIRDELTVKFLKSKNIGIKVYENPNDIKNEFKINKEKIEEVTPEVIPEETKIAKDDVHLLYDTVEKLEKNQAAFQQSQTVKMMELTRMVQTMVQVVGPKNKEIIIQDLTNKMNKLPMDKLIKLNTLFDVIVGD